MSTCRSCDAPLKWIKTKDGKNMPCDPEAFKLEDLKASDVVVSESGEVFRGTANIAKNTAQRFYFSHFSTCPDANKFRR